MSNEERAALHKLVEEWLRDFDAVQDEWVEGYLSINVAIELMRHLRKRIHELLAALENDHA